jgi:hypothetical protein
MLRPPTENLPRHAEALLWLDRLMIDLRLWLRNTAGD